MFNYGLLSERFALQGCMLNLQKPARDDLEWLVGQVARQHLFRFCRALLLSLLRRGVPRDIRAVIRRAATPRLEAVAKKIRLFLLRRFQPAWGRDETRRLCEAVVEGGDNAPLAQTMQCARRNWFPADLDPTRLATWQEEAWTSFLGGSFSNRNLDFLRPYLAAEWASSRQNFPDGKTLARQLKKILKKGLDGDGNIGALIACIVGLAGPAMEDLRWVPKLSLKNLLILSWLDEDVSGRLIACFQNPLQMLCAKESDRSQITRFCAEHGYLETLRMIDALYPGYSSAHPKHLAWAISCGHIHVFEYLLEQGAPLETPGYAALAYASQFDSLIDIVAALVHAGVNINFRFSDGTTSLIRAARRSEYAILDFLLSFPHIEIDAQWTRNFKTALTCALEQRDMRVTERLLKAGADVKLACARSPAAAEYLNKPEIDALVRRYYERGCERSSCLSAL